MLRVSVVQALRYIGVRPAAMGDRPPTVDVGNDESAIYRTLIDSKTGVESGLATLIARACARLFGLRLHACYLESLRPQQHAARQGREPRTDYGEWAPRNWPKWRALQGPGPICFPKSLTTGVSEPGFFYDEEAMFQRAVDSLTFVSGNRVEFAGQDKSQRIGDSVSLRPNVGLGAGVDVLFRLTAVDIDRDHEFALQGHTRQVRRASSDDSLHIGLGEVVEMDDPFFNVYEYDEPLRLPTNENLFMVSISTGYTRWCQLEPAYIFSYSVRSSGRLIARLLQQVRERSNLLMVALIYFGTVIPTALTTAFFEAKAIVRVGKRTAIDPPPETDEARMRRQRLENTVGAKAGLKPLVYPSKAAEPVLPGSGQTEAYDKAELPTAKEGDDLDPEQAKTA